MRIETGIHKGHKKDTNWSLDDPKAQPPRQAHYWVEFSRPFGKVPKVTLGLYTFDFINHGNQRIEARVTRATNKGFEITYKTWGLTRVWFAGVYWTAFEHADSNEEVPNDKPAKVVKINHCNNNDSCSPD